MKNEKIVIIGHGNVGTHLHRALNGAANIVSASDNSVFSEVADIYILALPDKLIPTLSERIKDCRPHALVVHTAGSIPMVADGVFYPLQTFSKSVSMDYSHIPFLIEGRTPQITQRLTNLASQISDNVRICNSEKRKIAHLAAVIASNLSNHLWAYADALLKDSGLEFNILLPLLKQSLQKLNSVSPYEAQTGPARRNDTNVIQSHLDMLSDNPRLAEIYSLISESIIHTYND